MVCKVHQASEFHQALSVLRSVCHFFPFFLGYLNWRYEVVFREFLFVFYEAALAILSSRDLVIGTSVSCWFNDLMSENKHKHSLQKGFQLVHDIAW